jgi:extradiol dioxygenase family protein
MQRPCFHLSIPARQVDVSTEWYVRVLDCRPGRRSAVAAILDLGGHQLVLQHHSGNEDFPQPGIYPRHFGLVFESLASWEALRDRIAELGEPFRVAPKRRYPGEPLEHWTFFLQDPSDNWLEFKHYSQAEAVLGCRHLADVGDRDLR